MTGRSRLINWIEKLDEAHVLVLGDVMLDRFIYGKVTRVSPEAPVPVLKQGDSKTVLGGAGNVVRNLQALGSQVYFISLVGNDSEGFEIREMLGSLEYGIESNLIVEKGRDTTVKIRFVADHQQVLRVDKEVTRNLNESSREKVLGAIREFIDSSDVVILSDYGKGFFHPDILTDIIEISRKSNKPILVDPKGVDFSRYRGASLLSPNLKELSEATRSSVDSEEAIVVAAMNIINSCEVKAVLTTRSREGMSLVQASGKVNHLTAEAKEVFDVSGAGDTVISTMAAAIGAGASLIEAAEIANVAAGIVVGKVGTAVTYSRDLIHALHHQELSSAEDKVLDINSALDRVELWRRKGYKIGFTNGVFDLLHPGHLSLLSQAAANCDRLIVGLNGDTSVRCLNGEEPVQNETARSAILASLEFVDAVIVFWDETPICLIEGLRPDVLIKGGNYKPEEVVGADLVKSYGGQVVLAEIVDVYKTNSKIAQITNGIL